MVLECQYGGCKYEEENKQLKKSLPKCFQHAKSWKEKWVYVAVRLA